jgi:predicted DNA-binding antitoxin AbrB/MazE fold protein
MTFHTDAIYEGGVLRPLVPLNLHEQEVVSLAISTVGGEESLKSEVDKQRKVLAAFVAKMESLPDDTPQDGLSNRDHDELIYGK